MTRPKREAQERVGMRRFDMPLDVRKVTDEGTFDGYLSVWDEVDSYGTMTVKGAFKRTLKERGPTRPMLWSHDVYDPIGVLHAKEDDRGLHVRGEFNRDTQRGREVHSLTKQGAVSGLSQGFSILASEPSKDNPTVLRMTEIDLWEGSLCVFPALDSARVEDVRANPTDAREALAAARRLARTETALGLVQRTIKRLTPRESRK